MVVEGVGSGPGMISTEKWRRIVARITEISISAKFFPMHSLGPALKGRNTNFGSDSLPPFKNREGS